MSKYTTEKQTALDAVIAASKVCRDIQKNIDHEAHTKDDNSPVTIADYASQVIICKMLKESFPAYGMVSEEHSSELMKSNDEFTSQLINILSDQLEEDVSEEQIVEWVDYGENSTNDKKWILDPIDGTKGFLRGDQYAIALALMDGDNIVLGMMGCPNLPVHRGRAYSGPAGCLFVADKVRGSYRYELDYPGNVSRLKVSDDNILRFVESLEAAHSNQDRQKKIYESLGEVEDPVRVDSQAKYGIVARGEASAYIRLQSVKTPEYRQKIWDHAAGCIILEEAGGKVTDIHGKALDFTCGDTLENNIGIVATNGKCHEAILKAIKNS